MGTALSVALCAFMIMLGVRYIRAYADAHHRKARVVVAVVLLLNIAQSGLHIATVLTVFAYHYGDFGRYVETRFADSLAPLIGVLLQLQAQLWMLGTSFELAQKRIERLHSYKRRQTFEAARTVLAICTTAAAVIAAAAGCAMAIKLKLVSSLVVLASDTPTSRLFYVAVPLHFAFATVRRRARRLG